LSSRSSRTDTPQGSRSLDQPAVGTGQRGQLIDHGGHDLLELLVQARSAAPEFTEDLVGGRPTVGRPGEDEFQQPAVLYVHDTPPSGPEDLAG
jgi:hypothetical protein